LKESFRRVRAAGVTGKLAMRADSGFYSAKIVTAVVDHRKLPRDDH
jgi:hypothetical protein